EAKTAMNHMRQGLCRFDAKGGLLLANQRFAELFGLSPADLRPGLRLPEVLRPATITGAFGAEEAASLCEQMRVLAEAREPASVACEPAGGRALAILFQPMDDGGWIATYEDIS